MKIVFKVSTSSGACIRVISTAARGWRKGGLVQPSNGRLFGTITMAAPPCQRFHR